MLNDTYRHLIGGKITIPSKDADGNYIEGIYNCVNALLITDVYFLNDTKCSSIGADAFRNLFTLKKVHMPATITKIGNRAFDLCEQLELNTLPANMVTLGEGAFSQCKKIAITSISSGIKEIPLQCFAICYDINIGVLGNGIDELVIGPQAFLAAHADNVAHLTINDKVSFIVTGDNKNRPFSSAYRNLTQLTVPAHKFGYSDLSTMFYELFGRERPDSLSINELI